MQESLLTTIDQFTPEILVILAGLLVITTTLFLWLWFANRRSYNMLKHQLPASVVKTYLDSIIQNSTSLQSQLFRGNAGDLAPTNGLPTIFPVGNLGGGDNIVITSPGSSGNEAALREQLNQRLAEIASLQSQLSAANGAKKELEIALSAAQARIKELEAMLAAKGTPVSDNSAMTAELAKITKERNALQEKLKEYEIIEDDLANLKRLQQENGQLRKALEAKGGVPAEIDTPAPLPSAAPVKTMSGQDPLDSAADIFEEVASPEPVAAAAPAASPISGGSEEDATAELAQFLGSEESAAPIAAAAATEIAAPDETPAPPEKKASSDKTPEDLLSEFEKMLG
mgnify:CR=1 FL=1